LRRSSRIVLGLQFCASYSLEQWTSGTNRVCYEYRLAHQIAEKKENQTNQPPAPAIARH
jgi:hypothetical protein